MTLLGKLRQLAVKVAKGDLPPLEYTQENVDKIKKRHGKTKLVVVPATAVALAVIGAAPADAMPPPPRAPNCDVQYSPIHKYTSTKAPLEIKQLQVYNVCKSADLSTFWSRMIRTVGVWDTTNGKNADCSDWHEIRFHVLFEETTAKFDHFFQDFAMGCDNTRQAKTKEVDIPTPPNINLFWGPNKDDIPIWHSWNTLAIPNLQFDEHWEEGGKLAQFP